jgi:uncharacterized repeat protein (TIGR01451 family)
MLRQTERNNSLRLALIRASALMALIVGCVSISAQTSIKRGTIYEPDCNDPDAHDHACTDPTPEIINQLKVAGYEYYVGHAEPTTEFFSTRGTSGSNMQWKLKLPLTEPTPTQDGTKVALFELYPAFWLGLALCDPNSNPGGACVAASDANNPATSGAAFLELQFYPPGQSGCSTTQWCVSLHINTLQNFTAVQRNNCVEPTTAALLTTNGSPGGTTFLMSNGDNLLVTIRDTANGLQTVVQDLTTSTTGSMVASGANGFVHNKNQTDCTTEKFDFHAMYATASPGQVVPWAGLAPNVSWDFEIGHWELCGDAACTILPDGGDADNAGTCSVTQTQQCTKNSQCPAAETCQLPCTNIRGIGGCFGKDSDHDGTPYQADWPDGTANHPASAILGSADDKGIGPMSAHVAAPNTYDEGYNQIDFRTTEATNGAFYPFFSQAGTGTACRFYFGNDIPGTTTDDFGKATQYGTEISNPCLPGVASDLSISKTGPASVAAGTDATYTIKITNHGPSDATNVTLTDLLPTGVTPGPITGPGSCTVASLKVTCSAGSLSDGASITYTVTVHIPSAGTGTSSLFNTAKVTADQLDPDSSNNSSSSTASIRFVADLSTGKSASQNPVDAGKNLSYFITVHNAGPSDAKNVGVTDNLPPGVTFLSSSPVACTGTTVRTCNVGTVVSGGTASVRIVVSIPPDYLSSRNVDSATITNTANVTSAASDPNPSNNKGSVTIKVISVADLDLTVVESPNPVHQGQNVTYTMTYKNLGPSDARYGTVLQYYPPGFQYDGSTLSPCGNGVGDVLCQLGYIVPAGFGLTFQVTYKVPGNFLGAANSQTVNSEIRITSHSIDPDPIDSTNEVSTTVIK